MFSVFDEEFDSHLNPNYTFENFIEGSCNKLCCVAGNGIAEQPGKNIFNPLLVYGKSGVGKTHLAQAIGHRIKQIHPSKKVLKKQTKSSVIKRTPSSSKVRITLIIANC